MSAVLLITIACVSLVAACGDVFHELVYSPQTQFAPGFDENTFSRVEIGMAESEVLALLGPPLRTFSRENITFLVYSDIGHYTHWREKAYRQRWLAVDHTSAVVHVFRRTITTDHAPTRPVTEYESEPGCVYRPDCAGKEIVRPRYRER